MKNPILVTIGENPNRTLEETPKFIYVKQTIAPIVLEDFSDLKENNPQYNDLEILGYMLTDEYMNYINPHTINVKKAIRSQIMKLINERVEKTVEEYKNIESPTLEDKYIMLSYIYDVMQTIGLKNMDIHFSKFLKTIKDTIETEETQYFESARDLTNSFRFLASDLLVDYAKYGKRSVPKLKDTRFALLRNILSVSIDKYESELKAINMMLEKIEKKDDLNPDAIKMFAEHRILSARKQILEQEQLKRNVFGISTWEVEQSKAKKIIDKKVSENNSKTNQAEQNSTVKKTTKRKHSKQPNISQR